MRAPGMVDETASSARTNCSAASDLVDAGAHLLEPLRGQEVLPHVVGGEGRVGAKLAGQKARRERHAGDDAVALLLCEREELQRRLLVDDVVEHLQRVAPAAVDDLEAFIDRRDRDAPVADLADLLQPRHRLLDIFAPELLDGRVVGLVEIDVVGAEALERSIDRVKDVFPREVFLQRAVAHPHDADFRGDDDALPGARQHDAEERLAAAEAVGVGGVEEVHAEVAGAADRGQRLVVVGPPPSERRPGSLSRAADGPRAETDFTDPDAGVAERTELHASLIVATAIAACIGSRHGFMLWYAFTRPEIRRFRSASVRAGCGFSIVVSSLWTDERACRSRRCDTH